MSWKSEVIADSSGKWYGNGLTFATKDEAQQYVYDLGTRWTSVQETRVIESSEPASHLWLNGKLMRLALKQEQKDRQ
jgi:hypothetical protein